MHQRLGQGCVCLWEAKPAGRLPPVIQEDRRSGSPLRKELQPERGEGKGIRKWVNLEGGTNTGYDLELIVIMTSEQHLAQGNTQ